MDKEINLNYAATSAKKPAAAIDAMIRYLTLNNANSPGRSGGALTEGRYAVDTRMALCQLFGAAKPEQVVLTPNVTTSLNMVLHGLIRPGDHVITTTMEHNAVARPLTLLQDQGVIEVSFIPCGPDGSLDPGDISKYLRRNTTVLVMSHASNVTGTIHPYEDFAKAAKDNGLYFVLDGAQTAGYIDFDFEHSNIDVLAFTGHKGLMGPAGTGGFIVKEEIAGEIRPWLTGGTGSISHLLTQPAFLPDKFESGTPNIIGIIGLGASVAFVNEIGTAAIKSHEDQLTKQFLQGVEELPLQVYGPKEIAKQGPVVSVIAEDWDSGLLSARLHEEYGIITRPGLHCAPLAHKTIGTYPEGTLRFSFGYFTTSGEVGYALDSLKKLIC